MRVREYDHMRVSDYENMRVGECESTILVFLKRLCGSLGASLRALGASLRALGDVLGLGEPLFGEFGPARKTSPLK